MERRNPDDSEVYLRFTSKHVILMKHAWPSPMCPSDPYSTGLTSILDSIPLSPYFDGDVQSILIARSATFCMKFLCDQKAFGNEAALFINISKINRTLRKIYPRRWRFYHRTSRSLLPQEPKYVAEYQTDLRRIEDRHERMSFKFIKFRDAIRKAQAGYDIRIYPTSYFPPLSCVSPRPESTVWFQYIYILRILPQLLTLAGYHALLVELCKKRSIASMSILFPWESSCARRGIVDYLARMAHISPA